MKKIICPMYWDCGSENNLEDFKEKDRIKQAIKEKRELLFIDCPKCKRMFSFYPNQWRTENSHCFNPSDSVKVNSQGFKEIEKILKKYKIEIPKIYLDYLKSDNFNCELSIFKDEENFKLYDLQELCEVINIDDKKLLRIQELKAYANTILEVNNDFFSETQKKDYLDLSTCLNIGHRNTTCLFIDRKDNSLNIFNPDGGDIEKLPDKELEEIII